MKNKKLLAASLSLGLILGANGTVFAAETNEDTAAGRETIVVGDEKEAKESNTSQTDQKGRGLDSVAHKASNDQANENTAAGRETIVVGDERDAKETDSSQANQKGSGLDSVAHKSNNDKANENTAAGRETIVVGDKDKANNEAENNSQSGPEGENLDQVAKQDKASDKENTAAGRETIVVGDKDNNKDQANADRTQSGPQGEKLGEVAEKESEKDSEDKDSDDTNAGSNPKTGIGSTSALAVLASAGLAYISSKRK